MFCWWFALIFLERFPFGLELTFASFNVRRNGAHLQTFREGPLRGNSVDPFPCPALQSRPRSASSRNIREHTRQIRRLHRTKTENGSISQTLF